jgi:hypothetical protein
MVPNHQPDTIGKLEVTSWAPQSEALPPHWIPASIHRLDITPGVATTWGPIEPQSWRNCVVNQGSNVFWDTTSMNVLLEI